MVVSNFVFGRLTIPTFNRMRSSTGVLEVVAIAARLRLKIEMCRFKSIGGKLRIRSMIVCPGVINCLQPQSEIRRLEVVKISLDFRVANHSLHVENRDLNIFSYGYDISAE